MRNRPTYTCSWCHRPGWGRPAVDDGKPVHPVHLRPRPKARPDPIIRELMRRKENEQ